MGRFYQTSAGQFVDNKMFEAPHQLMAQVIQGKDKAIDTEIGSATAYLDKLKADVLKQDSPELQQEIKRYEQKISDVVNNIKLDPLNYNKYSGDITQLGRDINANWTTGKIGTMQQYKKQVMEEYDKLDELAKKDPKSYDAQYIAAEKANILKNYQGVKWNQDLNKAGATPDVQDAYYAANFDDKFLEHMKASGYSRERDTRGGDGYIYRNKVDNKILSEQEVAAKMYAQLQADTSYQQAVDRRKQLGLEGYENADLASAYIYEKDNQGKPVFKGFNNDHYGRLINAAAKTYAYQDTSKSNTISNDEGYWKRAGWAREDDKAAKEEAERVNTTYEGVYTVGTNSADNFQASLINANRNLAQTQQNIQDQITNLRVKPGSETEKLMRKGNVQAMIAAGVDEPTAHQLSAQYKREVTKKNLLNAQALGFQEYAAKKGGVDTTKMGWLNDPRNQKLYNEYLTSHGAKDENVVKTNMVTLNGIGMNKNTVTELHDVIKQRFDDVSFNISNTVKGSEFKYTDKDGNDVVYVSPNDKRAGTTVKSKTGTKHIDKKWNEWGFDKDEDTFKTTTYKVAPGGQLSVSQLIKEGAIETRTNKDGTKKYITRDSGKEVGLEIDEKTIGLDTALDDNGNSNLGMTVQIGNRRLPVLIPTTQVNTPSLMNYLNKNAPEMQWNNIMNKTNLKTLGRKVVAGPEGESFMTDHGKAYVIHKDGSMSEVVKPEQIKRVHQLVYSAEN